MNWDLPTFVDIDGLQYKIRNRCDYRVVLDTISALKDNELDIKYRYQCALFIFYEDLAGCNNIDLAINEMLKIINYGEEEHAEKNKPTLMDWEHDFKHLVPPISRVLGYDVRMPDKYTHWYSFLSGYMEIGGECTFATIVSIRNKRAKGKKLEKWEIDFLGENRRMVDLPQKLTSEEQELLNSEW